MRERIKAAKRKLAEVQDKQNEDQDFTSAKLAAMQNELHNQQLRADEATARLAETENKLASTKDEASSAAARLAETENKLASTKDEANAASDQLAVTQSNLRKAQVAAENARVAAFENHEALIAQRNQAAQAAEKLSKTQEALLNTNLEKAQISASTDQRAAEAEHRLRGLLVEKKVEVLERERRPSSAPLVPCGCMEATDTWVPARSV